ncbi:MAG: hypothetical protein JSV66_01120 [Trueperaceae bacterium]|nr:MAG: hypothetical protein JSV66_01120 [Trueperaceae bacterium]
MNRQMFFTLAAIVFATLVIVATISLTRPDVGELANRIADLDEKVRGLEAEINTVTTELTTIGAAVQQGQSGLSEALAGLSELSGQVAQTRQQLSAVSEQVATPSSTEAEPQGASRTPTSSSTTPTEPAERSTTSRSAPRAGTWNPLKPEKNWVISSDDQDLPEISVDRSGTVYLRGKIYAAESAAQNPLITLPSGCRPADNMFFRVDTSNEGDGGAIVMVESEGAVNLDTLLDDGNLRRGSWISLDNISFESRGCSP